MFSFSLDTSVSISFEEILALFLRFPIISSPSHYHLSIHHIQPHNSRRRTTEWFRPQTKWTICLKRGTTRSWWLNDFSPKIMKPRASSICRRLGPLRMQVVSISCHFSLRLHFVFNFLIKLSRVLIYWFVFRLPFEERRKWSFLESGAGLVFVLMLR